MSDALRGFAVRLTPAKREVPAAIIVGSWLNWTPSTVDLLRPIRATMNCDDWQIVAGCIIGLKVHYSVQQHHSKLYKELLAQW